MSKDSTTITPKPSTCTERNSKNYCKDKKSFVPRMSLKIESATMNP